MQSHNQPSLQQLAPSAALPAVRAAIAANSASKAAGRRLLSRLPLWQRLASRAKSLALLALIAASFWPCLWCTLLLTCILRLQQQAGSSTCTTTTSSRSEAIPSPHSAAPAGAAASKAVVLQSAAGRPTALVTGGKMTKALHVCRHLHAAGWRVVLLETHKYWHVGSRWSSSVAAFKTVPVPEDDPDAYVAALAGTAKAEGVSLFVPVSAPVASLYDALAAEAMPPGCLSWSLSPATTAELDNKASFSRCAASLGLLVPDHFCVTSPQQLQQLNSQQVLGAGRRFVLKDLLYDSVHRADMVTLPCPPQQLQRYLDRPDVSLSPQHPWILQEFIEGKEFSCYTLAYQGRVVAHADSEAALSNLNYAFTGLPAITAWVTEFVAKSGVTGQLCFDFIMSELDGRLYCIECNPRTSSIITEFHNSPHLAAGAIKQPVLPASTCRQAQPTFWFWHEFARLATNPGYLGRFITTVQGGVDAVFDADPLPFLGLHYLQIPMLLLGNVWRGNPWTKVDLCIGKIAELYGD